MEELTEEEHEEEEGREERYVSDLSDEETFRGWARHVGSTLGLESPPEGEEDPVTAWISHLGLYQVWEDPNGIEENAYRPRLGYRWIGPPGDMRVAPVERCGVTLVSNRGRWAGLDHPHDIYAFTFINRNEFPVTVWPTFIIHTTEGWNPSPRAKIKLELKAWSGQGAPEDQVKKIDDTFTALPRQPGHPDWLAPPGHKELAPFLGDFSVKSEELECEDNLSWIR
jgi:hypothetical protein